MSFKKMQYRQALLSCKRKQEQLRRELKKNKVLHDIKDIFVDTFDIHDVNEKK